MRRNAGGVSSAAQGSENNEKAAGYEFIQVELAYNNATAPAEKTNKMLTKCNSSEGRVWVCAEHFHTKRHPIQPACMPKLR